MKTYNHAMTIAFALEHSTHPTGEDITGAQLRVALQKRLDQTPDDELEEACLPPYDTYEEEPLIRN